MPIKTFRGLLEDGQQERIRLETLDGKKGYRIKKLELIPNQPFNKTQESVIKIFSIKQTAINGVVNFSEQTLLAAGIFKMHDTTNYMAFEHTVFESVTFNQDIFITNYDAATGESCNYYLELEQISLDDVEATAVILKNFRNTNTV